MPILESIAGSSAIGYGFGLSSTSIFGATPLIWTQLGSAQTNIDIQNIPQTYTSLRVVFISRVTTANWYVSSSLSINNTGTSIYSRYATGNSGTGGGSVYFTGNVGQTSDSYHYSRGTNSAANYYGTNIIDFNNYTNTNQTKTYLSTYHDSDNSLAGPTWYDCGFTQMNASDWGSTAAINRLTFTGSFAAGTSVAVIGYKKGI